MNMSGVLVTGATGFVGKHLTDALRAEGRRVIPAVRKRPSSRVLAESPLSVYFDLNEPEALDPKLLKGIDCIYHLAAHVHVMRAGSADERLFDRLNVHATRVLARCAAVAGVKRFIYLSSIKVNGERTFDRPFSSNDSPSPEDAYGRSKWKAEQALMEVAENTGLEIVIVRPPLIYGPGVGANFRRLLALVDRGLPLPFGRVDNKRSLVSIWNLISLLLVVGQSRDAQGRVWLVSDNEDMSTPRLMSTIASALGDNRPRLVSVPVEVLRVLGKVSGRQAELGRLLDSLQVDISETCSDLNWMPPLSAQEGIARTVRWFQESHRALG